MNIDKDTLLMWSKFSDYIFYEEPHEYYWKDKKVKTSVTQFVSTFFDEFNKETISLNYAKKNGLNQQDVLDKWERDGKISSTAGTIVHSFMESMWRGKVLPDNYSEAKENDIYDEVKAKVEKLKPLAEKFYKDAHETLIPLTEEFTVGIEDFICGNIDLLVYNKKKQEIQIFDYKNLKKFTTKNDYGQRAKFEFSGYDNCHLVHYSIQLNIYKAILKRVLGIEIGDCWLVFFNENNSEAQLIKCLDLQKEVGIALDRLMKE